MMKGLAIFVAALAVAAVPAGAATLSLANGNVLVNSGNGFVRATEGQQVSPGTRVMIGAGGGNATIAYDLNCLERVTAGQVVTVKPSVPCTPNSPLASPQAGLGIPNGALVAGGAVLAVGVGIGIYQLSKPSSP